VAFVNGTSTLPAWRPARQARDARFDGRFFVGVKTTGIYCRPICPARLPLEKNVAYFPSAAAAAEAGFRPCLRCRPEVAPGSPAWTGTSATVRRAWRLIDEHATGHLTVEKLAASVGIGSRHLRRLFMEHTGASPQSVVQTRRLHFAKQLVDGTTLSFATIALASGFGSIRRFNAAFRDAWGRTPSSFRRPEPGSRHASPGIAFRLAYRPPYDWRSMLAFLERRAVPGLERVNGETYGRTIAVSGRAGWIEVGHDAEGHALLVDVRHPDPRAIYGIVRRVRAMFDVDADPLPIGEHLSNDPLLRGRVERRPGLRIPGAWDPFELTVRAIVGQQVSVAGAVTLLTRIVRMFGGRAERDGAGAWIFPDAAALAEAALERAGLTRARAAAIRDIATAVRDGELSFDPDQPGAVPVDRLRAWRGIGAWTAQYVAMRACGDPDAFPAGDLALQRATGLDERSLAARSARWSPWRAYAAIHLWTEHSNGKHPSLHDRRQPRGSAAPRPERGRPLRAAVRPRPPAA
jgi:AraC family transcriptional regulator of adaptative response / DNA-3-methyladenine glycosylase II